MKNIIVVLFASILISFPVVAQKLSMQNLVGKWEAVDSENDTGGLEIPDSSKIFLVYGNERKQVQSFRADFSKSPARLDLTLVEGGATMQLHTLIKFVGDDMVQWQVFEGAEQQVSANSDKGELVYLRRKK